MDQKVQTYGNTMVIQTRHTEKNRVLIYNIGKIEPSHVGVQ